MATITNGVALVGTGGDTVVDDVDGAAVAVASVDGGIMIPLLANDADGATVDGRVSVDDNNSVSVDKGSVDSADGAAVDDVISLLANDADGAFVDGRISVDDADGALIDEGISVGEEHEVLVLVPIGGGVVDALASTEVPVRAGTC